MNALQNYSIEPNVIPDTCVMRVLKITNNQSIRRMSPSALPTDWKIVEQTNKKKTKKEHIKIKHEKNKSFQQVGFC